jgi:hypothetical protein
MRFHAGFLYPAAAQAVFNRFLGGGNQGNAWTSTDGITFTSRSTGMGSTIQNIIPKTGLFVLVGAIGRIFTSTDTVSWVSRVSGVTTFNNCGIWTGAKFVVGNTGFILDSTDGITWTSRAVNGFVLNTDAINAIAYNGSNLYVAVGASGKAASSTDGVTWTSRTSIATTDFFSAIFANSIFVVGGSNGRLMTSGDGINWTSRVVQFGTTAILGLAFKTGQFIGCGNSVNACCGSADGVTWTSRTTGAQTNTGWSAVVFANGIFVMVGAGTNAQHFTSSDGITWTSRTAQFVFGFNHIDYGGG